MLFKASFLITTWITSWFAIGLAEIRTRCILREKADCKQSRNDEIVQIAGLSSAVVAMTNGVVP